MQIPLPDNDGLCDAAMRENLQRFIDYPEPAEIGPCPGCIKHIATECSPKCPDVAKALSIDPVRYPLEKKVIPLVYEVMATAGLKTSWSCEGHMNNDSELWKLPQVCFYSELPIYSHLLLIHLSNLQQQKKLKYPWHIVMTDFSLSLNVTYSIQPNLNKTTNPHLGSLQNDLLVIADDMHSKVKIIAKGLLEKFC